MSAPVPCRVRHQTRDRWLTAPSSSLGTSGLYRGYSTREADAYVFTAPAEVGRALAQVKCVTGLEGRWRAEPVADAPRHG